MYLSTSHLTLYFLGITENKILKKKLIGLHVQDSHVKWSADPLLSEISKVNENYKTKDKLVSRNCSRGIQQMKKKLFKNQGRCL